MTEEQLGPSDVTSLKAERSADPTSSAYRSRAGMSVSDLLSTGPGDATRERAKSEAPSDQKPHSVRSDDDRGPSRKAFSRVSSADAVPTSAQIDEAQQLQQQHDSQLDHSNNDSDPAPAGDVVNAYQYAAVQQITDGRENVEYILTIREQPKHSRMCGVGEKADRRPIDPAPIIQLRVVTHPQPGSAAADAASSIDTPRRRSADDISPVTPLGDARNGLINGQPPSAEMQADKSGGGIRRGVPVVTEWGAGWEDKTWYLENPYYFMYAMLADADTDEELHLLGDGKTRYTTGSCVSCLYHLKDIDGSEQGFFVFPDLSIRVEGRYRLKLCLFETIGHEVHHCKSIYSKPFNVYTAKRFPGMEESTLLSKSFADQGLKVRVRKNPRARRARTGEKRKDAIGSGDDESDGEMMAVSAHEVAANKRIRSDGRFPQRKTSYSAEFAYDPYAEPRAPPSQLPPPPHTGHPAYGYNSANDGHSGGHGPPPPPMLYDAYRGEPPPPADDYRMVGGPPSFTQSRPPPPPSLTSRDAMHDVAMRGELQRHPPHHHGGVPPPPPGYMDGGAADVDARRAVYGRGGGGNPGARQHYASAQAEQQDRYSREREANFYQQEQEMRSRSRRSTMSVGPVPPPGPNAYGHGPHKGGVGGREDRFGHLPPLPPSSSAPSLHTRDRSISDPYGHRPESRFHGGGEGKEMHYGAAPQYAPLQHDEGSRNRLPPLHVALSPGASPRAVRASTGMTGMATGITGTTGRPSAFGNHGPLPSNGGSSGGGGYGAGLPQGALPPVPGGGSMAMRHAAPLPPPPPTQHHYHPQQQQQQQSLPAHMLPHQEGPPGRMPPPPHQSMRMAAGGGGAGAGAGHPPYHGHRR